MKPVQDLEDSVRTFGTGKPGGPVSEDFEPEGVEGEDAWAAEERVMKAERLQVFGAIMAKQRDEWVAARAATGWDVRVQEDLDQYEGRDTANLMAANMMTSVEQGYPVTTNHARATRSTVFINITRPKTNASEARVADVVLPTDEENWSIAPTPNPIVVAALDSNEPAIDPLNNQPIIDPSTEAPLPKNEIAKAVDKQAKDAAEAMTREIKDQLTECDFQGESRKVIHDAAKMGVGVMKGPVPHARTKQAWAQLANGVYEMQTNTKATPASWRVDPRNVWEDPSCGDNIQNGRGIYEIDTMTSKQVRALAKQPGFLADQIRQVLEEGPGVSKYQYVRSDKREIAAQQANRPFEVWYYTGEVEVEDMRAAGVPDEELPDDDMLDTVSASLVMINTTIIKATINPSETGELPYDFFPWELEVDSARGVGVPYLLRSQQKVINAGWRMMMDNAGMAVGPQIVVKRTMVTPADGKWEIAARKIWYAKDDVEDVTKAFTAVEFSAHQEELAAIIQMGEALADTETGTPQLTQGEKGNAPDTLGGMQLLMANTNVVTRRLVKQYDDRLTKPHIRRYYDYNMAYSEKPDIKGDFDVDARGSNALITRDVQNQAYTNLLAAAANPIYASEVNPRKIIEKAIQAQHIDPDEILFTEEEKKANADRAAQNPPQDPRIQSATITAQARAGEAEQRTETQKVISQDRLTDAREERAFKLEMARMERELAILKLATEQNMTLDQVKAGLADTAIKERTKRDLFSAERKLALVTGSGI